MSEALPKYRFVIWAYFVPWTWSSAGLCITSELDWPRQIPRGASLIGPLRPAAARGPVTACANGAGEADGGPRFSRHRAVCTPPVAVTGREDGRRPERQLALTARLAGRRSGRRPDSSIA